MPVCRDDKALACANDPNCYISYKWNDTLKYMFIYHFFGLLWTNQFIVGFSCVTIAGELLIRCLQYCLAQLFYDIITWYNVFRCNCTLLLGPG